jgi:hypothetical protein
MHTIERNDEVWVAIYDAFPELRETGGKFCRIDTAIHSWIRKNVPDEHITRFRPKGMAGWGMWYVSPFGATLVRDHAKRIGRR